MVVSFRDRLSVNDIFDSVMVCDENVPIGTDRDDPSQP